jgi:hypothetical protein
MPIPSFTTPPGADTAPPLELIDLVAQFVVARAVGVCAKLRIADHLGDGAATADELAGLCGAHPRALYRMLRLLAAAGLFTTDGDSRFRLTPLGACLRADHPVPLGSFFRMIDGPIGRVALELGHTVRTGEPADRLVLGAEAFEYLAKHPEESADFDEAMTDLRKQFTGPLLMAYDYSGFSTIVDVAGGQGFFLRCLLEGNPGMTGVLFDQPHVIETGRAAMAEAGLAGRCDVVGGDFFESVPPGADGYILSWIIHDWDDERALAILRSVRRAIAADGRLLLFESVVPEGDEPGFAKVLDAFIMAIGGVERTEAEYAALLAAAGFRLERVVPTLCPQWILEAVPV